MRKREWKCIALLYCHHCEVLAERKNHTGVWPKTKVWCSGSSFSCRHLTTVLTGLAQGPPRTYGRLPFRFLCLLLSCRTQHRIGKTVGSDVDTPSHPGALELYGLLTS